MKKKSKIIALLIILFLHSTWLHAQNLVPNPSFEDTVSCPNGFSQIDKATGWFRWGGGTPDYLNACSSSMASSVPNNFLGHQFPSGPSCEAYAGLITFTFASNEYIATQLLQPLAIGQKYFVSYKISLADTCKYASNNVGILFRVTPFYNTSVDFPYTNYAHVNALDIITDKENWTTITGSFIADSAYNYIVVGNFFEDTLTDTISLSGLSTDAYYFIDDICVSTDSTHCIQYIYSCYNSIIENNADKQNFCFPNPTTGIIFINYEVPTTINIYNQIGQILLSYEITQINTIDLSKYPSGVYLIESLTLRKKIRKKIILSH